jgi:hypothetical protein
VSGATAELRAIPLGPIPALVELGHVARACIAIVIGASMYLGTDSPIFRGEPMAGANLLPYQEMIATRSTTEQRTFRELQEGLLEAEMRRSESGMWAEPAQLAEEGVPPFAFDPTVKTGPYRWRLAGDGLYFNYIGEPERPEDPAWMILITEPVPGAPPDLASEDEEHHRLIDGTMLHVSSWVRTDGEPVPEDVTQVPANRGWTQLYAVTPSLRSVTAPGGGGG